MSEILLQGILYDKKSSFMPGAAKGPPEIRKAYHSRSANYFAEDGQEISPAVFQDTGDMEVGEYFDIERHTASKLKSKRPLISLGGDHSITYPLLKAFDSYYGPIDILHIDAHPDLYQDFEGDPYSHACPFARIMEEKLASGLYQLGIRCSNPHQQAQAEKYGVRVYPMDSWSPLNMPKFKRPIYISLDLDALDPAFAPGVSHHEPGGFSTREVLTILQNIQVPVLGADIVELNPLRDNNGITAMVAAKILKEIAAAILRNKK